MSLTSDEVNFLVYRYLQESGFQHAAFALWNESYLSKSSLVTSGTVPPGGLISLLQKGLLYVDVEWHVTEEGMDIDCEDTPTLLTALGPKPIPSPEARQRAKERERENKRKEARASEDRKKDKRIKSESDGSGGAGDDEQVLNEISSADVTVLSGHESEVFACTWNPTRSLLASGSADCSAIIWEIPPGLSSASAPAPSNIVLRHYEGSVRPKEANTKDVTTVDWNPSGSLLATGSYDGMARIWSEKGQLVTTLQKHKGPIFSLKWNKSGDSLLSGSVDKTAIIWDAQTGEVRQHFEYHTAPTLDVDWRDNTSFASCSSDSSIVVCKLGETKPLQVFQGHKMDVNAVKWDPTGKLLASCSDDSTAKIWSVTSDQCVLDLKDHTKEIYTIKWHPTADVQLATASFDTTVKLWDINMGKCINTLSRHKEAVYSLAYSPDGRYIASGSFDNMLHVWSVKDGALLKSFRGNGGIFDVSWNNGGNKIAACLSNNTVCVMDLRL